MRYYARMRKGSRYIYANCHTYELLQVWIRDNEKLGYELIGKIERG